MSPLRDAVRRHGWAFSAEQAANPEMTCWRSADGGSAVAYVTASRGPGLGTVRVAAGDPLAPAERLARVAIEFEQAARADGDGVLWFGASSRFELMYPGTSLVLGSEPVVEVRDWRSLLARKSSLRAQIARAANKGVSARWVAVDDSEWLATQQHLRQVLDAWLGTRGMPQLHFLAQPDVLRAPGDRRFLIAERDGRIEAYLSLAPVGNRAAALIEWIIRRPDAPNGTSAFLIDMALRDAKMRGIGQVSLGLVPLSSRAPLSTNRPSLPIRALLAWTRAHSRRFYHFDGLERFKAKFEPSRWEPSYLLTPKKSVSLSALYAVADAFAGPISPERLVASALVVASIEEANRMTGGLFS